MILASCSTIDQKTSDIEIIDLSNSKTKNLSDITQEIKIIQLDNSFEALIGMVTELNSSGDHFYILDSFKSKAIYSFNSSGMLEFKLSKFGSGPGEYTFLTNTFITDENIYAWDAGARKLISYDKRTGQFLREKRILDSYLLRDFVLINSNEFILANGTEANIDRPFGLYKLDSNFNVQSSTLSREFI